MHHGLRLAQESGGPENQGLHHRFIADAREGAERFPSIQSRTDNSGVRLPALAYRRTLLAIAALGLGACATEGIAPAPRLEIAATIHDAGRVHQGERIEHTFVFRNGGGRDLRINRVRASCDCTAGSVPGPIPPGAVGEIPVSLDTTGRFGRITRSIAVFSNDPAAPALVLKLVADVEFDIAADPPQFYVGRVRAGDEVRVLGRVVLADRTEIMRVESPGPVAKVHLSPSVAAEGWSEHRLKVHIRENAPPGPFTDSATLHTTSARTPELSIAILGVVEERS